MKRVLIVLSLSLTFSLPGATAAQTSASIARVEAMLAKPGIVCGRFDQTKKLAGMKKPLASNGRFCVVAGKGVMWRTLKPFPNTLRLTKDEIVHFQGERVAMRLDARQEPTVRMINSVLFALLSGELGGLEKLFVVDGSASATSWKVALKARQPALAKAVGAITLEGGTHVKGIEIAEASGDHTGIVFSEIRTGEGAISADEAKLF